MPEDTQVADKENNLRDRGDVKRVQFGCGPGPVPKGWINFDASPTLRIASIPVVGRRLTRRRVTFDSSAQFGDIVKGLPVEARSCHAVYSSHVLEHLPQGDVRGALENTLRILRPGGVFRVVLPDLRYLSKEYVEGRLSGDQYVTELYMGLPEGKRRHRLLTAMGNSRHLWMWDEASLSGLLLSVGFIGIRRATFGDRDDDLFADVESEDRWTNCLGIQAEAARSVSAGRSTPRFARIRISKPPSRRALILGEMRLPIDRGPRAILLFIESAGSSAVAAVISEATIAWPQSERSALADSAEKCWIWHKSGREEASDFRRRAVDAFSSSGIGTKRYGAQL